MFTYTEMYARAEKVRAMVLDRAREESRRAGCYGSIGVELHNASVAHHYGQNDGWGRADKAGVRRALALVELSMEPHRVLTRWARKAVR